MISASDSRLLPPPLVTSGDESGPPDSPNERLRLRKVAHDLKNWLGGIEMLAGQLPDDDSQTPETAQVLAQIRSTAGEAMELCQELLADGLQPASGARRMPIDVDGLLGEVRDFLDSARPTRPTVRWQIDFQGRSVVGNRGQLKRVVMNLVRNATEAVEGDRGEVTVRGSVIELGHPRSGASIFIEVSDNGCGMDEATRRRAFEPTFTTKETGYGLGLASVREIVGEHGGKVEIDSELGRGTTVRVRIPASADVLPSVDLCAARELAPAGRANPDSGNAGGAATRDEGEGTAEWPSTVQPHVLLIDDQQTYRVLGERLLAKKGFQVTSVKMAEEALMLLVQDPSYSAILLDLHLTGTDGVDAFRRIRAGGFDLPVIVTSGCTRSEMVADFRGGLRPDGYVEKPFDLETLASALHSVLPASGRRNTRLALAEAEWSLDALATADPPINTDA